MLSYCQQYETDFGKQRSLCHHDLHGGNILLADQGLAGQNIIFLDWEFAGLGIASFDFAALACELSIDISSISKYSGISATELEIAASVYRYICEVYNRAIVC
jgi:thiamine kinase-like enzyme